MFRIYTEKFFNTVVFAIKRSCRRLSVTVAGPLPYRLGYGYATVPAIPLHWNIRSGYGPATVPVRSGTFDFNEDVPQRLRSIYGSDV